MDRHQYSFEKLEVWQKARILVKDIYDITNGFPNNEKFGLSNQIRRAAISVTANIAEGSSRLSNKDQSHFYQIAYSSLMEVLSHIYVALDLGMISEKIFKQYKEKITEISRMLNGLYKG